MEHFVLKIYEQPLLVIFCVLIAIYMLVPTGGSSANMAGSPAKSRKHKTNPPVAETSVDRKVVNANWMNFVAALGNGENFPGNEPIEDIVKTSTAPARARKKRTRASKPTNLKNATNGSINSLQSDLNTSDKDKFVIKSTEYVARKPTLTKFVAMDCEMVGIGEDAKDSMLARVSIVNTFGDCLYDKFVKPREAVIDYRTSVSGVRKEDLDTAESFKDVQQEVSDLLKGRILVGHAIKHDLNVLFLSHPNRSIRDTSRYKPFRMVSRGGTPSLKKLAVELLGVQIQKGEHSSVEDARAAMQLYISHSRQWESSVAARDRKHRPAKTS